MSRSPSRPRLLKAFRVGSIVVVLLLMAAGAPSPLFADAALDAYNSAVGLQREKRWDLAAQAFRRFLKEHPKHEKAAFAQMYLGLALLNQDKYADARTELRAFIATYPQSRNIPDAMYRVGEASYLMNDLAAAEKDFGSFVSQYPKHELIEWALPYLADAQLRQKKYDAAIVSFRTALEQFPKGRMSDEARFGMARTLEGLGKPDEALKVFREIASEKLNPRAPQAQLQIGNAHYDRGEFDLAAAAFLKLEENFPKHSLVASARVNSGYAYYQAKKYKEAIARFDEAGKDPEQKATADYWSGVCEQTLGNADAAAKRFQAVIDADPKGPLAEKSLNQWAEMDFQAGKFEAAGQRYLQLVDRFPQSPLAFDALQFAVEGAIRSGKPDDAQKALDRFPTERRNPKSYPQYELLQGRILELRGGPENLPKARARYDAVVRAGGTGSSVQLARLLLARSQNREGQQEAALETLKPLLDELPKGDPTELSADVVSLTLDIQLAAKKEAAAIALATTVLQSPKLAKAHPRASAARAAALARTGEFTKSQLDINRLEKDFPMSGLLPQTLFDVAEAAYARSDYDVAGETFDRLSRLPGQNLLKPAALSGLAWSRFESSKFAESAAAFAEVGRVAANDLPRAQEAAFMEGLSWQRAANLEKAAEAYASGWSRFAPKSPAAAGSEAEGQPLHFVFRCGWKAGQVQARLKQVAAADKHYEGVTRLFPTAKDRDKVIDDWALLHYEAEDFAKADELFLKLVTEYPKSDRADDARLNLAESDFVSRKTESARKGFQVLSASATANDRIKGRAIFNLAKIAAELREWKEVIALAEKHPATKNPAAIDGDRLQLDAMVAEAKLNLDDAKAARTMLEAIYARKADVPKNALWFAQVRILLAETNCQLKDYDAVAKIADEFRKEDPQSKVLHRMEEIVGRAFKNQAKFVEARSQFEKVINDPNAFRTETAAKSQFLIAETFLLQKDFRNAQIEYYKVEQLYKFPEWQSSALFQVAKCDEAMNHWKEAVKVYEDLLKKYAETPTATRAKTDLQSARKRIAEGA